MIKEIRLAIYENIKSLSKSSTLIISIILFFALVSTVLSDDPLSLLIFGFTTGYIGLVVWIGFFTLGLLFRDLIFETILSKATTYIFSVIFIGSLIFDHFLITHGYRLGGLLMHPTNMAALSAIGVVLALYRLTMVETILRNKWPEILNVVLGIVILILTQSRIGYLEIVLVLSLWALKYVRSKPKIVLMIIPIIIIVPLVTRVSYSYFERFYSSSVRNGLQYRLELYKTSGRDLLKHNVLIGNGPGTLPTAINNQNEVPVDIANTLKVGIVFGSTHDMYFDIAYFFGVIAAIGIVLLSLMAFRTSVIKGSEGFTMLMVFIILISNAIFNIVSLELTSLYIIVMIALLPGKKLNKST